MCFFAIVLLIQEVLYLTICIYESCSFHSSSSKQEEQIRLVHSFVLVLCSNFLFYYCAIESSVKIAYWEDLFHLFFSFFLSIPNASSISLTDVYVKLYQFKAVALINLTTNVIIPVSFLLELKAYNNSLNCTKLNSFQLIR